MRARSYPGSAVTIESTLDPGVNYKRYVAWYESEGLKIYGLLTVPNGTPPPAGWPVIVFNHGYIPPAQYRTTSRYVAYQDWLARSGYIVFKPDYRGNGSSEGAASGAYGSPDYVVDVLNAVTSMEHYPGADANRLGMWGHSMGGYITLRAMVISHDIKAGVIWSGVVGSYPDLLYHWHRPPSTGPGATDVPPATGEPATGEPGPARGWRSLVALFGPPETNADFWNSISATSYLADLSGPLQLHHDTTDSEVPFQFSQTLAQAAAAAGQTAELFSYPGDDHNLAKSFGLAMTRTIAFFDRYLKPSS
jgi:dipeptidyl aminopeptidase/acylaminoacyl peptidase